MKLLILDHFRRWWWVLAIAVALEFRLGWQISNRPQDPFEFWALFLTMLAGANLLSFNLKRGLVRSTAILPLTGRKLGRSWWLATVPIPAIVMPGLLFLGAATFCHLHPGKVLPISELVMASLFSAVWLGMMFTMIFEVTRSFTADRRERYIGFVVSVFSQVLLFGSLVFCLGAAKDPFRSVVLLAGGALLTVRGWLCAEQFEPGRAGLYLGRIAPPVVSRTGLRLTPLRPGMVRGQSLVPEGYGGLSFLVGTTSLRIFLQIAAMLALMALLMWWRAEDMTGLVVPMFAGVGSLMCCGFVIVQLLPVLRQLRYLRTLPLSATRLAAAMLVVATLPLVALGGLTAGVAVVFLGVPAAGTFLSNFIFVLATASFCVFFAVWPGEGRVGYLLLIVTVFGLQQVQLRLQAALHVRELSLGVVGAIAATGIALSFLLVCYALRHSSRVFRARAINSLSLPWGLNR